MPLIPCTARKIEKQLKCIGTSSDTRTMGKTVSLEELSTPGICCTILCVHYDCIIYCIKALTIVQCLRGVGMFAVCEANIFKSPPKPIHKYCSPKILYLIHQVQIYTSRKNTTRDKRMYLAFYTI